MRMFKWWLVVLAVVVEIALVATATELEPTNIEIILDASNSMSETVPGGVKIDVARKAIEQLLEILPASYNVGLRGYGHRFSHTDTERSCTDTELLSSLKPLTQENRTAISQRLTLMQPKGMTPIAYTLEQAVNDFFGMTGKNVVILVSDGEETCGGDPLAIADYITSLGIGLKVYVIGFDVGSREQLEGIALRTGGRYYAARNAIELGQALKQAVWEATSVLFFDDFNDVLLPAWKTTPVSGSSLGTCNGTLTLIGDKLVCHPLNAFVGNPTWQDYIISLDVLYYDDHPWNEDTCDQLVVLFRVQDVNNMIGFFLRPGRESGFRIMHNGIWRGLSGGVEAPGCPSYRLVLVANSNTYSIMLNNELLVTWQDSSYMRGSVGIMVSRDDDRDPVYIDNFTVAPLE